ncbi:hypothetical protein PAHAL_9G257800 [Panicum hallii]|uniref:Uncharacterized protein n=1 Tax=Panicum hallii TaxID=206008 RepID=A0A2T8I2K6_9POAL|nr:hypothetical protein PAHAL_9G257800 [Panicum hallii]
MHRERECVMQTRAYCCCFCCFEMSHVSHLTSAKNKKGLAVPLLLPCMCALHQG